MFMEMLNYLITIAYVLINGFAVLVVIGSFRWPTITRLVFFGIFIGAALINTRTLLNSPELYLNYAEYAIPLYQWFIRGAFESVIQPVVLALTLLQGFIALSMFMKRRWFRAGCLGGIVFCLGMAPLGMGAFFPATLLLAIAFYRLYKHEDRQTIQESIDQKPIPFPLD